MYDSAVGRWLSEDPLGHDAGDPNLNRYVGNFIVHGTDPAGLVIKVPAGSKGEVDDYLGTKGVAGWRPGSEGDKATYSKAATFDMENLESEILGRMINSSRPFSFASLDSLKQHVAIRVGIVASAQKTLFGFGSNIPTNLLVDGKNGMLDVKRLDGSVAKILEYLYDKRAYEDPDRQWAFRCLNGTVLSVLNGIMTAIGKESFDKIATATTLVDLPPNSIQVRGIAGEFVQALIVNDNDDWIPGDWGYIWTLDHKKGKPVPVGQEGINFIYLGKGKYWSHGLKGTSIAEFMDVIKGWPGGKGELQKWRRCPRTTIGEPATK